MSNISYQAESSLMEITIKIIKSKYSRVYKIEQYAFRKSKSDFSNTAGRETK